MKKFASISLTLVLAVVFAVTALAAPAGFVSSPSGNDAPVVTETNNPSEDCTNEIEITSFADRDDLEDSESTNMEKAYDEIVNNEEGSSLDKILEEIAKTSGVSVNALAISDLFNVGQDGCTDHDSHNSTVVTLSAETLENFVGLLRYVGGEWKLVDVSSVSADESTITFTASEFGPYAIVVDGTFSGTSPDTGDNGISWIWFGLMLASGLGLAAVAVASKKRA